MPLPGTNRVVPGSRKPLPNMGYGRISVDQITGSQAKGYALGGKHDAGFTMDRRKCDKIGGVEDANDGRVDIRYRLQQET